MHDLVALCELAEDLARQAAAVLLDGLGRLRTEVTQKTSPTDVVTDMDRASEKLIVEGLARHRPDDAVLAEEGGGTEGTSGVRWVIDPLDGTTNYVYGLPAFGVSIAAEVDGLTAVGVVADPSHGEVFSAVAGRGACRNGEPIEVSGATDLATALVATGFSYRTERRSEQARLLNRVLPRVRDLRRFGAASVDLCWVACGRFDAYYEAGLQPWDLAAGALIAAEAGAVVEGIEGAVPESGSVMAVSPALAEPLRRLLEEGEAGASGAARSSPSPPTTG